MKSWILVIACFLTFCVPAFAFWSGTVQDQIISQDDNMLGWYTRSVVDPHGTIHTIWNERVVNYPTQQEIHYSRSSDNGRTWSSINQDVIISFNDGVNAENGASIAANAAGDLFAVWSEDEDGYAEIHYSISHDGGNTWSGQTADLILSYPGGPYNALNPWITVDHENYIHVVWNQVYPQTGTGEIYYSRSLDGGMTWSSQTLERIISYPDGGNSLEPRIAVDESDHLYVIWKEPDDSLSSRSVINFSRSTDHGDTWTGTTADYPVTASFRIILYPDMTVDADNYIHVVWKGTQDTASPYHYEIYHSRSTDGGLTWSGLSGEQIVSYYPPGDPSSNIPNIGADHRGNVIVVWDEEYDFGINEIMVSASLDGGVTWSGSTHDEIISFPDGHPGYRPFIVAGLDDTLHVTWNEGTTTSYYQIHYSRGDALSAAPAISITLTPINPPIVIPATGGGFAFDATVANGETSTQEFDAWIMTRLPNQNWYGPLLGPIHLTVPAGVEITRNRTQIVPAIAPAGVYLYEGRVGVYPAAVWNSDSFQFTKLTSGDGAPAPAWENSGEDFILSADPAVATEFALLNACPNPFNPVTALRFTLPAAGWVKLQILDVCGRKVSDLVDGWRTAGSHAVTFDGSHLTSGVYLCRLSAGNARVALKLVLLK
jgi:hypothetical protein